MRYFVSSGRRRSADSVARGFRRCIVRLEQLDDRWPPGAAFLTGLPATPTTGLVSAVETAPPGPARRPAAETGLAETGAFAPLTGLADACPILINSFTPMRRSTPSSDRDELASLATSARRASTSVILDAGPLPVGSVSAVSVPAGSAGVSTNGFVLPPPTNYQLDQAATVVAPRPEPDDLPPADLDPGAGVQSAGVRALFDLGHPTTGPFPSNVFT